MAMQFMKKKFEDKVKFDSSSTVDCRKLNPGVGIARFFIGLGTTLRELVNGLKQYQRVANIC